MICKSGEFKLIAITTTIAITTVVAAADNGAYRVPGTFLHFHIVTYLIFATTLQGMHYDYHFLQIGK